MLTDLSLDELRAYRSEYRAPVDFDAFWAATLAGQAQYALDLRVEPVTTALRTIDVFDLTFAGFGGDPVRAWLRVPRGSGEPRPVVVQFHGYASGRGAPIDDLVWPAAGYVQLAVDVRGQGASHAAGATGDPHGSGPSAPGFLTRGIDSPHSYYYRRVYVDAVRAVAAARTLDVVDPHRVAAIGNSQGGGIALAVAGLVPDLAVLYAQAPFLCDIRRATLITDEEPYAELARYLSTHRDAIERVFRTLAYFDGIAFAARAHAPAWFSTGLMDPVCPPSTVFAAHAEYAGRKHLAVWPYNAHEAGGPADLEIVLAGFAQLWQPSPNGRVPSISGGAS